MTSLNMARPKCWRYIECGTHMYVQRRSTLLHSANNEVPHRRLQIMSFGFLVKPQFRICLTIASVIN